MIEHLRQQIKRFTEQNPERLILGIGLAYFCLLSYAIYRGINSATSARITLALQAFWGAALLCILAAVLLHLYKSGTLYRWINAALAALSHVPIALKTVFFVSILLLPGLLIYSRLDRNLLGDNWIMASVVLLLTLAGAILFPSEKIENLSSRAALSLMGIAFGVVVAGQFGLVNNYPFSLTWSEGNRFYDYSLIFGQSIYQHSENLVIPYGSPGRYGLWGIWFLFDSLPIAFHRAWDALLWFVPTLLFGWFALRRVDHFPIRLTIALWIALFLNQGPIYAPLLLSAILAVLPMDNKNPWIRAAFLAVAGVYVGLSRWTWSLIPGMWGALIDLYLYYPQRTGSWFRRLLPTLGLGLAGSLPGILVNLNRILAPQETTLSLSQPLLWYRLLPNSTFRPGILLGLAYAVGPLLLLMIWLLVIRLIRLDGLQALGTAGVLLAFLATGLVASVKIGGGSNLHNLDMFLVSLMLIVALWLAQKGTFSPGSWPLIGQALLAVVFILPAYTVLMNISHLDPLPDQQVVQKALKRIDFWVEQTKEEGEVLFMDQRQLLTFGYIKNVELVPDYEKKYVMDQAMADNHTYFEQFYEDLREQRFSLIVSELLYTQLQDRTSAFSEENNAWVKWVSKPILCYYQPEATIRQIGVELLTPRENPGDCP